jgi:protein involved in polysaccharide export with SLBB domain
MLIHCFGLPSDPIDGDGLSPAYFVRPPQALKCLARANLTASSTLGTMRKLLWRSALLLVAVHGISSSAYSQSPQPKTEQIILNPGDSVRIVVWRKPEMSGDFIVAPDNTISHPLYRMVQVGGIPFDPTGIANIRAFLARFEQDPQFVAEPLVRIAVSGEVGKPQVFAVRPETSIADAVAQSGGPTQNADRNKVIVLRKDPNGRQRELSVSLFDPETGAAYSRVHSGDQIVVNKRKSFLRDIIIPTLGIIGSVASIGLLIDRATR